MIVFADIGANWTAGGAAEESTQGGRMDLFVSSGIVPSLKCATSDHAGLCALLSFLRMSPPTPESVSAQMSQQPRKLGPLCGCGFVGIANVVFAHRYVFMNVHLPTRTQGLLRRSVSTHSWTRIALFSVLRSQTLPTELRSLDSASCSNRNGQARLSLHYTVPLGRSESRGRARGSQT
jgi:hypothetical protein